MFGKKNKLPKINLTDCIPVIHASICNGEQVAGFKNVKTNEFTEIMTIKNEGDLKSFCENYNVNNKDIVKEY